MDVKPTLTLTPDREFGYCQGGSFRYLACKVSIPETPNKSGEKTSEALNLGLVIDVSGSMRNGRLESAIETACDLVNQLGPEDRLSLVSFASEVEIHFSQVQMNQHGRIQADQILRSLRTRGQTNLAAGWFEGARQVALGISTESQATNQILLLSDGMANQGMRDPKELAEHASRLRGTGISTSCIGIGDDYEITYLQALAEAGGGRLHDAQFAADLVDVVLGELSELRGADFQDFRVVLSGPDHTEVDLLNPYRVEVQGGDLVAILGNLFSGRDYQLIWRARLPSGPEGMEINLTAVAHWRDRESGEFRSSNPAFVTLILQEVELNEAQDRDMTIAQEVLHQWQGRLLREAMNLNRKRRFHEAKAFLEEQIFYFERYCEGIPDSEKLLQELKTLHQRIGWSMRERNRKEVTMRAFKTTRGERDYRVRSDSKHEDFFD